MYGLLLMAMLWAECKIDYLRVDQMYEVQLSGELAGFRMNCFFR